MLGHKVSCMNKNKSYNSAFLYANTCHKHTFIVKGKYRINFDDMKPNKTASKATELPGLYSQLKKNPKTTQRKWKRNKGTICTSKSQLSSLKQV